MDKPVLTLDSYQQQAAETAVFGQAILELLAPVNAHVAQTNPNLLANLDRVRGQLVLSYLSNGLAGEAGEIGNKVKKVIRGDIAQENLGAYYAEIAKELGDVLWYVAMLASALGQPLSDVGEQNLNKLNIRAQEGKLHGSGDNR